MNSRRCHVCVLGMLTGLIFLISSAALAQDGEVAAIITELKLGAGVVELRSAGSMEWRQAQPLLALRPGDVVRATEDASVVLVLSGGLGSRRVDVGRSPFVVPAASMAKTRVEKAVVLLQASLRFLSAGARDTLHAVLVTRGDAGPPLVVAPRNGAVRPGLLTFEWRGSGFGPYAIRVIGPRGRVLERTNLTGTTLDYPLDAPSPTPGVRYSVQVLSERYPPQEAWFEVLDSQRARIVERDISELERTFVPLLPANSVAVIKAGYLAGQELFYDARVSLLAALARDPDEPTLHVLLAEISAKSGLPELAAGHYAEAQFLLTRGSTNAASRR